ncbi:MAG: anti-sigma factor antagonist [Acidobacteria bacterium]|nr:MAG: anti-sigma factor antagonist [Acidobacteriota bacterium]
MTLNVSSTKHMIPATKPACKTNMGFQVAARERDRVIVVDVVGRLTLTDSRTQVRDLVHVFTSNGHKKFLINLEGVDFVDSNGLGELTRCFCSVRQAGGDMKLVHVNARVQALLEMTRINTLFEIHAEEHAALEAFR